MPSSTATLPHVINPSAIYTLDDLARIGVKASAVRREHRAGRLRISKRLGRYFVLGAWLLEWIEAGEMRKH